MELLRNIYFFPFISILIFSACDKGPPIPEEKFVKVYVDLLIMQDTTSAPGSAFDSIKTIVFTRYDVSQESYNGTIDYYNSHPEKWAVLLDSATAYVEHLMRQAVH